MSMENPVNGNGLLYFWQKLKAYFAKKSELDSLSGRVDDIVATGGEPNQNAFSTVKVGSTSVAADSETDTLVTSASSYHSGGVNCVMGDGSVRFVSDTIDCGDLSIPVSLNPAGQTNDHPVAGASPYGVWGAMGTCSGGETTQNM